MKDATNSQHNLLIKNNTWDLVDLPEGKNLVGYKWLFKVKHNADRSVSHHKTRLVAQGFSKEAGEDFDEVFVHFAKYDSIRSILAIANQFDMEIIIIS